MILFAVAEKESFAFAITREGFDWKPLPLGAEPIGTGPVGTGPVGTGPLGGRS
jgi:hypothetical protein